MIPAITASAEPEIDRFSFWVSTLGILIVVVTVLGGIWLGFFTPTEGAGAGAFIALLFGILKGMRARDIVELRSDGRSHLRADPDPAYHGVALLAHARHDGGHQRDQNLFLDTGWSPVTIAACDDPDLVRARDDHRFHLDHATHGDHLPSNRGLVGYDPIAFAIIGILAIEAGLLTPPFGILVFTVKAAVDDCDMSIWDIFRSPYPTGSSC